MRAKTPMRARLVFIAAAVALAACGGGNTGVTEDAAATSDTAATGTVDDGDAPDAGAASPTSDQAGTNEGDGDAPTSGTTAGGTSAESVVLEPPPDPDELPPADGPPDHNWQLFRAIATVSVGGGTYDFIGTEPIWFTDMSPVGEPLYPDGEPLITVAGCSILQSGDNQVIAQASFHHATDRFDNDSFSMSDNGDGTVTWGLFDWSSGKEWSATGPGEASIEWLRGESRDDARRDEIGFAEDAEELYVLIEFEGEATENFSTDKSQASSRVLCHYLTRPR